MQDMKKKETIILHHHLGLGDHLICNGLVNVLSKKYKIYLISRYKNYDSVKHLYSDNDQIIVIPLFSFLTRDMHREKKVTQTLGKLFNIRVLFVGFQKGPIDINWDESFYHQVNIPFEKRYEEFYTPFYNKLISTPKKSFRLIHSTTSSSEYNLKIENSNMENIYVTKKKRRNIFAYTDLIKKASEIHCVDSAFIHLVDSFILKNTELYYHNVRKANVSFTFKNNWEIINYD